MAHRQEKLSSQLAHLTAKFLAETAGKQSLVTVTDFHLSPDGKRGTVFLSVLPDEQARPALAFARRRRSDLRRYIHAHLRVGYVPTLSFELDWGEKNRQRIDEISVELDNELTA